MKDISDNNDDNNMIAIENHVKSDVYFPFNRAYVNRSG